MIYKWGDERRFNSYSAYFRRVFDTRVQKLSVNAAFTCPNRDGTVAFGGCTFCNNDAFSPSYCQPEKSVRQQLEEGIEFHQKRYRTASKYLAYFQSYSNTYASLDLLQALYSQAFELPDVMGVVIGTRPDCIDDQKLDYFAKLAQDYYVVLEYGVESCYDKTLERVNRGHNFECAREAIFRTAAKGLRVGAHFILGFPGETREMMLAMVDKINELPIESVKFHQLQIFKETAMAKEYASHPEEYMFFELDEYIDFFIEILRRLRPDIVVERFASEAPPRYHSGPTWGMIRNEQLLSKLEKRLEKRNAWQGELYVG